MQHEKRLLTATMTDFIMSTALEQITMKDIVKISAKYFIIKLTSPNTNNSASNSDGVGYNIIAVIKCECPSGRSCNSSTNNVQHKLCRCPRKTYYIYL